MKFYLFLISLFCFFLFSFSTSIYDIQYTQNISGSSPYEGQTVTTTGIVTRVFGVNAYIQDDTLPWHGLLIYNPPTPVEVGDSVTVTGQVVEYNGKTEISNPTSLTILAKDRKIPGPVIISTGEASQEKWEGMFVQVQNCVVTQITSSREWNVDDGSGELVIYEDNSYPVTTESLNDTFIFIRGCMDEYNGKYELKPFGDSDALKSIDGSGYINVNPKFFSDSSYNNIRIDIIPDVDTIYGYVKYLKLTLNQKLSIDSIKVLCDSSLLNFDSTKIFFDTTATSTILNINNISFKDTLKIYVKNYFFTKEDTIKFYSGVDSTLLLPAKNFSVLKKIPFENVIDISEVQSTSDGYNSKYVGQVVVVRGIVTGDAKVFSPTSTSTGFYIQDETGGVNVYSSNDPFNTSFKEGFEIFLRGTVTEYNGLTEIKYSSPDTDIYFINDTISFVEPTILTNSQGVSEINEGRLLKVSYGKILTLPVDAGTGKNFQIQNGFSVIDVRINESTGLYSDPIMSQLVSGKLINVTGIGGQYDNTTPYKSGYQLLVRKLSDLEIIENPDDTTFSVKTFPNPFSTDYGQVLRIEVGGLNIEKFTVKIFDINGRHIVTLAENQSGSTTLIWDGKNKYGSKCSPGVYILNVAKIDDKGYLKSVNKPLVISTKLK